MATSQNTTDLNGLSARDHARISNLIARHAEIIERTGQQLATDYNVPANRFINAACNQMGCSRLDWEKITAVQNGWRFEPVPASILARWERY